MSAKIILQLTDCRILHLPAFVGRLKKERQRGRIANISVRSGISQTKRKGRSAVEHFLMKALWWHYLCNYFSAICLHFTPLLTWAPHKTNVPEKKNTQMLFSCSFHTHTTHTHFFYHLEEGNSDFPKVTLPSIIFNYFKNVGLFDCYQIYKGSLILAFYSFFSQVSPHKALFYSSKAIIWLVVIKPLHLNRSKQYTFRSNKTIVNGLIDQHHRL